jgi:hypothetical protein
MGDREVEAGVDRLTNLRTRRKIGTGDQVQARNAALRVRHGTKRT